LRRRGWWKWRAITISQLTCGPSIRWRCVPASSSARVNPLWIPYLMRDTFRISEMLGLPYRWPRPDPVVVDPSTRAATPNQPYIHRLTRLGCAAAEIGRGCRFSTR
jgi:hypothetical protein